jgi:hypothetical protein
MKEGVFAVAYLLSGTFVDVEIGLVDQSQACKDLFNSNEIGHDQR